MTRDADAWMAALTAASVAVLALKANVVGHAQVARLLRKREAAMRRRKARFVAAGRWEGVKDGHLAALATVHHLRIVEVRKTTRTCHVARMFVVGTPYEKVEASRKSQPDWEAVEGVLLSVLDRDPRDLKQRLEEWRTAESVP